MSDINTEIASIAVVVKELGNKIESGYATKADLQKNADAISALNKAIDRKHVTQKSHPTFGTYEDAYQFVNILQKSIERSNYKFSEDSVPAWTSQKADLNSYGSGTGVDFVPTATSDLFSMLLAQGGVARREATVYSGLQGNIVLTKRNGTTTAAFTNGSGALKDDQAITPGSPGEAKVTLAPNQVAALALVSEKLLYQSAVNVAEIVALDMIEQAGVLEDNAVIRGDGTASASYGSITGISADTSVNQTGVAYASWTNLDEIATLTGQVDESVQDTSLSSFYMSGRTLAAIRKMKSTTPSVYYLDPTTGKPNLFGYNVNLWHRMDAPGTAKYPVFFGCMKKAVMIGTGRDYGIVVDRSYKFNCVQAAFRLAYDFDAKILQPTALARLATTS